MNRPVYASRLGAALVPLYSAACLLGVGARAAGLDLPAEVLWGQLGGLVGLIGLGIASPRLGIFARPLVRGPADRPCVALTFDDGPDPVGTPLVLEVLARHHAPATFFVIGHKAARYPTLMAEIARHGHQIENHSYAHSWATPLQSVRSLCVDLLRAQEVIAAATGVLPRWLRPPIGLISPPVAEAARRTALHLCHWSCTAADGTAHRTADSALRRLAAGLGPGAILVLHDGAERQDRTPIAPVVLERLLPLITDLRLTPVLLRDLVPAPPTNPGLAAPSTWARGTDNMLGIVS